MDFGRLPSLTGVDFGLPPDASATARVLARATPLTGPPAIRVGAPTFANKPWLGTYYPAGTPAADLLRPYARLFPALELNSTHYGLPEPATVARWTQLTPPGFRFCPKLPQRLSHDLGLSAVGDPELRILIQWLAGLGERAGLPFVQLPPTFGPERLPALERFLLYYKECARAAGVAEALAVELRHPLWFASLPARAEAFALLEALGMAAVISDVAGRRDVLHQHLTTPVALIRFNGHGLHPTDYTRLDAWADRLTDWLRGGLREVYFFIHQKEIGDTPVLARYLIEGLNARTGLALAVPLPVAGPVQGSLF